MKQRHQDILFNVTGQSLFWDAPEGRPSSVTSVAVYGAHAGDTSTAESATTGSAAVETNPNTTFDDDSGFGQANERTLNLTATTGIAVGRTYLATTATGAKEWVEIVDFTSGATATARNPLQNAFASGDAFESTRISVSVDSTWVADSNNLSDANSAQPGYRVRWVYVVGGVTYVHDSYFDLTRYAGGHSVTPDMLEAMYPNFRDRLPSFHRADGGASIIDEAYQFVRWDLQASGIDDAAVRSADAIDHAVKLRVGVVLAGEDLERREVMEAGYRSFFDRIFRVVSRVDIAVSSDGTGGRVPATPLWSK